MSGVKITESFLIEKLMSFAEENGRTPTDVEFGHTGPVKKLFGSYKAFLQSQGFTERPGESELADRLHAYVNANGRLPKMNELGDESLIYRYYGTFRDFVKAYGYEKLYIKSQKSIPRKHSPMTPEDLLIKEILTNKLSTFVREHDRTPTLAELGYSKLIYKYYGSYFEFIKATGYEDMYVRKRKPRKKSPSLEEFETSFAKSFLNNRLHSFVEEHDRVPSANELGHVDQVKKYFGSYNDFVQSQGFSIDELDNDKRITKNDLDRKLKTFILINERVPNSLEFGYEEQIKNLFGTFDTFLRENGQEPFRTTI